MSNLKEGVKLKVLFLIPPDCDKDRYLFRKKTRNLDTFLPLGIAQLAAVLEKQGHITEVVDLRLKQLKLKELEIKIKELLHYSVSKFAIIRPISELLHKLFYMTFWLHHCREQNAG